LSSGIFLPAALGSTVDYTAWFHGPGLSGFGFPAACLRYYGGSDFCREPHGFLSEANMILAGVLVLFVFLAGPTLPILNGLLQNTGAYLSRLVTLGTWTDTYQRSGWQEAWTVFYWAWWIAWAPFVGTFIARISRGRTVREYVLGVLLAPAGMTSVWLTVFGTGSLHFALAGDSTIVAAAADNPSTALFAYLDLLPLAKPAAALAVLVIVLFFITSSDSGSLVVDSITSGGHLNPPLPQRVYWAGLEGVVAATLLATGGLTALQAGSIATGLPFAVILLLIAYALLKTLHRDLRRGRRK
jgi:choline/glycine/proline betaine transport protein